MHAMLVANARVASVQACVLGRVGDPVQAMSSIRLILSLITYSI